MSELALTNEEAELLVAEGWQIKKTSDGPEFFMDLGPRRINMGPVIMRKLKPMSFRSQARRYDKEYSEVAKAIGWGGEKFLPSSNKSPAMTKFQIETFDAKFAHELTQILKQYALSAAPEKLISDSIDRRKKVRWSLSKADFIDYAYLRRTDELERISLEDKNDGTEYISRKEDTQYLDKAIELSKR